jgi:hypothetical protein
MTKLREKAFAQVRELPEEDRGSIAVMLLSMTSDDPRIDPVDDATRAAILEGLAQRAAASSFPTPKSKRSGNATAYEGAKNVI